MCVKLIFNNIILVIFTNTFILIWLNYHIYFHCLTNRISFAVFMTAIQFFKKSDFKLICQYLNLKISHFRQFNACNIWIPKPFKRYYIPSRITEKRKRCISGIEILRLSVQNIAIELFLNGCVRYGSILKILWLHP